MGLGKKRKIGSKLPSPPGLPPMPAPPAPGMPLPPPPGSIPPPGAALPPPPAPAVAPPAPAPLPVAAPPAPQPVAPAPVANPLPAIEALPPSPTPEATPVVEEKEDDDSYSGLYAKKSGKPLQQVYGHIDRISQGDIGSLLDRYSDRFGHELDRDIIVMRKDERDDKIADIRDSPTVQLLNQDEVEEEGSLDGETLVELNSQLKTVEDELRRLKPEYQSAKADGDRQLLRELRPSLEALMAERKLLKAVIAGEADLDELFQSEDDSEEEDEEYEEEYEEEYDEEEEYEEEEEDLFLEFISIVDSLLGTHLSASEIDAFSNSDGFAIYRSVGSSPENASEEERAEFFSVVDNLLGELADEVVTQFVNSDEFATYSAIGAMYN